MSLRRRPTIRNNQALARLNNMSSQKLANILREMYDGAPSGDAVVMIHLFGIKYAKEIRESRASARDIVRAAEMSESYATEIQKGVRLAEYVDVKPIADLTMEATEVEQAIRALTSDAPPPTPGTASPASGVYAIRLISPGLLAPFTEGDGGLIYCGMSSDLAVREFDTHFNSAQTGFSTVRRSLGAILKSELKLSARPRGTGKSKSNFTNYRFDPTGERRLTDWMQSHLRVRTWATQHYEALEAVLKPRLCPLLNLEAWNPHNATIRALRKICADEARAAER